VKGNVAMERPSFDDLLEAWFVLSPADRYEGFRLLPRVEAEEFFLDHLAAHDQAGLIASLPPGERRSWMRLLAPDDAADVIQAFPPEERDDLVALLDAQTRKEVRALLAYAEDEAGGLMSPRFARVRPDMTVDEALAYLRRQARGRLETMSYVYVLDADQRLLGVTTFLDLFRLPPDRRVEEAMERDLVTAPEHLDQEELGRLFAETGLLAIPVVDGEGRMKGIVTLDDAVEVVEEEATEDVQRIGGSEPLERPYLESGFGGMVRARAGWLSVLFLGELLTASAMQRYEEQIARAVVLAVFVPLIISSGGNSGSQASTLVIRALALGELRLRDWWRVARRELASGLALGGVLAALGLVRILVGEALFGAYGDHAPALGLTVAASLLGVVVFGTLVGSMLPFLLRRLGLDPASASAPFVATLVDVTGLVIYFTAAGLILGGRLL
jgi:magnesium transporter